MGDFKIDNSSAINYELTILDLIPDDINIADFHSRDISYSHHFFHNCAFHHHSELTHKVYILYSPQLKRVLGFTSIYVNNVKGTLNEEEVYFPFLDVAFLSISKDYDTNEDNCKEILSRFLEKIEAIAIDISNKAGCRFIRSCIPYLYYKNKPHAKIFEEEPLVPKIFEKILINYNYKDLTKSYSNDINIKPSRGSIERKVTLKYFIRNLKFQK